MRGTEIRVAIEAERVTRVKYGHPEWYEDPLTPCADYCLAAEGLTREDVTRYVASDLLPHRTLAAWPIDPYPHHLCHAASAVMLLPPETRACVLVYDGAGSHRRSADAPSTLMECETFSFFSYYDGALELLGSSHGVEYDEFLAILNNNSNSIGVLYELITTMLGFGRREVGKTMGLAGWGQPRFLEDLIRATELGSDMNDVFRCDPFSSSLTSRLAAHLDRERNSFRVRADLAASMQELMNRCLLHCVDRFADEFDVLCLAGGCALNTVANGELAKHLPAGRRLVVPAHAGDAGIALGALWLHARERASSPVTLTLRGKPLMPGIARPGIPYADSRVRQAATADTQAAAIDTGVTGPRDLARVLAEGSIVGVFHGPSEIGPRALGGRSILADPRRAATRERLNRDIKEREPFRPLAPMILAERFDEYFGPPAAANPFMLVVAEANETCRRLAPAVVHVDGTARVQTVASDGDAFLYELLTAFGELTGIPMLLNTSYNRRGEPIVETPEEAVHAFLAMGLDGLWLQGTFISPIRNRPVSLASPA